MKSSQSNFDLRSPSSYLARSYLIATVKKSLKKAINQNLKCLTQKTKKLGQQSSFQKVLKIPLFSTLHQNLHCFALHDHTYNQFIEA